MAETFFKPSPLPQVPVPSRAPSLQLQPCHLHRPSQMPVTCPPRAQMSRALRLPRATVQPPAAPHSPPARPSSRSPLARAALFPMVHHGPLWALPWDPLASPEAGSALWLSRCSANQTLWAWPLWAPPRGGGGLQLRQCSANQTPWAWPFWAPPRGGGVCGSKGDFLGGLETELPPSLSAALQACESKTRTLRQFSLWNGAEFPTRGACGWWKAWREPWMPLQNCCQEMKISVLRLWQGPQVWPHSEPGGARHL